MRDLDRIQFEWEVQPSAEAIHSQHAGSVSKNFCAQFSCWGILLIRNYLVNNIQGISFNSFLPGSRLYHPAFRRK